MTEEHVQEAAPAARRTRIHLVYPHGDSISAPDAIGRELGRRLERRYEVRYHEWTTMGTIVPEQGDILLGHPHPDSRTLFRQSLRQPGWRRRLLMAPFHHGDLWQVAFVDRILPHVDLYLAISGPYWFRTLAGSICSHWAPKMIRLDMAIDRTAFPCLRPRLATRGRRRVLYVGHTGRGKNVGYLSQIAAHLPGTEFGWIGRGGGQIDGFVSLGRADFATTTGRELVSAFDFLLTVGDADANPTTILEAMAWGLIPVCTPTSGYEAVPGIINVPLADSAAAAATLRRYLDADDAELAALQSANWGLLDETYNWDRFANQVVAAIESDESPDLLKESAGRRLRFWLYGFEPRYGRLARSPVGLVCRRTRQSLRRLRGTSR